MSKKPTEFKKLEMQVIIDVPLKVAKKDSLRDNEPNPELTVCDII